MEVSYFYVILEAVGVDDMNNQNQEQRFKENLGTFETLI